MKLKTRTPAVNDLLSSIFQSLKHDQIKWLLISCIVVLFLPLLHAFSTPFRLKPHELINGLNFYELWYRYVPESGNWHGGTLTRRMAALSPAPLSLISCSPEGCW
jgi:hypothetical protein